MANGSYTDVALNVRYLVFSDTLRGSTPRSLDGSEHIIVQWSVPFATGKACQRWAAALVSDTVSNSVQPLAAGLVVSGWLHTAGFLWLFVLSTACIIVVNKRTARFPQTNG